MILTIQQFASAIPDLAHLSHNEKILALLWFFNEMAGQEKVQTSELSGCFRALALEEPQNIHQHLRALERRRPKVVLRDGGGFRLERRTREEMHARYGQAVEAVKTKLATSHEQKPKADIAIVVALKEEFSELHVQVPDWTPSAVKETGGFDYLFHQSSGADDRPYRCVVTFVGEMNSTPSALETKRLIDTWRPLTIVNLGIAGALSDEITLGDIVVATVVDDYLARSKAIESANDAGWDFELSGEPYRPSSTFTKFASHLPFAHKAAFERLKSQAAQDLSGLLSSDLSARLQNLGMLSPELKAHEGHVASGQVVAAAAAFGDWLRKQRDRSYVAIEMEAAGVLSVVHRQLDPQRTMIIRGISDFGDERKKELDRTAKGALRVYAMRNCIRYLFTLMRLDAFPFAD